MLTEDQKIVREVVEAWHTDMAFPPGGWEDDAPKWLETRAISERIDLISQRAWDKCTDAEVSGYMYCASLANPLDADWTQIITYEAAKQLPQLRENLKSIPEKLSDYQERELLDLKYKIRNSQIKHYKEKRKESSMAKRKVVLDERENGVLVGVMQEQCDPVTQVYEMTLEAALLKVPELLVLADTKWKSSPRNPAYQPPPAPAKTTAAAQKPVAKTPAATVPGKKAEELPLLKGKKSPVPQTKSPPPVPSAINVAPGGTEGTASDGAVGKLTHGPERVDQSPRVICVEPSILKALMDINSVQSLGEDPQKLKGVYFYDGKLYACIGSMGSQVEGIIEVNCYVVVPSAEYTGKKITHKDLSPAGYAGMSGTYKGVEYTLTGDEIRFQPKKEAQPAADVTKGVNPVSKAPETETKPAQTVNNPPVSETVVPKPATTAAATGEVAYWLKDGRGPFENVQVAMDAMGLDKATRPAHNRWDRLSTALKEQILRKPKA